MRVRCHDDVKVNQKLVCGVVTRSPPSDPLVGGLYAGVLIKRSLRGLSLLRLGGRK